jgi:hypothetical protein
MQKLGAKDGMGSREQELEQRTDEAAALRQRN